MSDVHTTSCVAVREAISADLDGEAAALPETTVARHLQGCRGCATFRDALPVATRRAVVAQAEAVPDLTGPILTALAEDRTAEQDRRTRDLRVLVGLAGVVQLALAIPVLVGLAGPAAHLGRDLGALELALGVGLLLAAVQPQRAHGVLPIAAVVAVTVTLAGVIDLVAGRATPIAELTHISELIGVAALWALTRRLPLTTVSPLPFARGGATPIRGA